MAFVVTWEAPGMTQEQYEATLRTVLRSQPPPAGLLVHLSGSMENGWRGIDVWQSQTDADAFGTSDEIQQALKPLGDRVQLEFTAWHTYDHTL